MIQAEVTTSGPLFDGRAEEALREYVEIVPDKIADEGVSIVRQVLGGTLQEPTGFYESQIQADRLDEDRTSVWDGGVIYGPWLESGAYTPQTSFAGYGHWREATQALDQRAQQVAQDAIDPYLDRMNG